MSGATRVRRRLDLLDKDLFSFLKAEDRRLYRIVELAGQRRARLREALRQAGMGFDPGPIRASLAASRPLVAELKRTARELGA